MSALLPEDFRQLPLTLADLGEEQPSAPRAHRALGRTKNIYVFLLPHRDPVQVFVSHGDCFLRLLVWSRPPLSPSPTTLRFLKTLSQLSVFDIFKVLFSKSKYKLHTVKCTNLGNTRLFLRMYLCDCQPEQDTECLCHQEVPRPGSPLPEREALFMTIGQISVHCLVECFTLWICLLASSWWWRTGSSVPCVSHKQEAKLRFNGRWCWENTLSECHPSS